MTIAEYLQKTQHAAKVLLDGFTVEWKVHKAEVIAYNQKVDDFKNLETQFHEQGNGDRLLELQIGAWEGVLNSFYKTNAYHMDRLEKIPSTSIMCGALLQIAKQGLSMVHGMKQNVPGGRAIGLTTLRDVIWEGRNQAMHFEEGNFKSSCVQCFSALQTLHGARFSLTQGKNLATYVVDALGWHTLSAYEADMLSL
jgi:hypothetical protein